MNLNEVFFRQKCIKKPKVPLTSGSLSGAVPPEGKKIVRQKLGAKELVSFGLIKLSFCWKYLKKIIKFVYLHSLEPTGIYCNRASYFGSVSQAPSS